MSRGPKGEKRPAAFKTKLGRLYPPQDAPTQIGVGPLLMAELDAIKALRPTGGLMLRRDGSGLPWGGKGEMLRSISHSACCSPQCQPRLTCTTPIAAASPTACTAIQRFGQAI